MSRLEKKKKEKRVARCVQNQREEGTGLNTACSDSHGFRLVKSIGTHRLSLSKFVQIKFGVNFIIHFTSNLKSSRGQGFSRVLSDSFLGSFSWKSDFVFPFLRDEKKSISRRASEQDVWKTYSARIEE